MRLCMRSYSTPTQENIAPEMKPWLIICTIAPCRPSRAASCKPWSRTRAKAMKVPSVTKPMCETDEYAISFFMSSCTSATRPTYTTATSDSAITSQAYSWPASGTIGRTKRRKP